jgi:hypothetical protein
MKSLKRDPMTTLYHVRLERAREPGAPEGDHHYGYDLVAPLDVEGRLVGSGVDATPPAWRVRRFVKEETRAVGHLLHGPGGRWLIHFDEDEGQDEADYRVGEDQFRVGGYVSVEGDEGDMHTFRVAQVVKV